VTRVEKQFLKKLFDFKIRTQHDPNFWLPMNQENLGKINVSVNYNMAMTAGTK